MRILQLLNWNLKTITDIIPYISKQKFDTIQVGPVQPLKDASRFDWWLVYQPLGFSIGNALGTKDDLKKLTERAKLFGIKITVDVVCNHVANESGEKHLFPNSKVDERIIENPNAFKKRQQMNKYDLRYCMVNDCIGLPTLNLNDRTNQKIIFHFLRELKNCGVNGFRFDAAKHIGLPNDGIDFFEKVRTFLITNNLFAYGEVLSGEEEFRKEFNEYIDLHCRYNDFIPNEDKAVVFVESHDNFLHNQTRCINTSEIIGIYGMMTSIYPKTLYYPRPISAPYIENQENGDYSFENMKQINEINYFEDAFLTDRKIKEANVKVLKR